MPQPIAILDCRIPKEAADSLWQYGYTPLFLPPHPRLPAPIASHPDLLLYFTEDAILTVSSYLAAAKDVFRQLSRLTDLPVLTVEEELEKDYPGDILLDALTVGNFVFCLKSHTAKEIVSMQGKSIVPVRQGYAKCSSLPVGEQGLITADPSVSAAAKACIDEVLTVAPGHIQLPGYNTGFIGGASSFSVGTPGENIFFCGSPAFHPDGGRICAFCRKYGKNPVALGNFPLCDVGTMFLIH